MDMSQYTIIFLEESRENLQNLNEQLLILEKNPSSKETVDEIFRVAHTLKGMAATMGFKEMSNLTHKMENILDLLRSGKLKVNSDIINVLFECLDMLSLMLEDIAEGKSGEYDTKDLIEKLHKFSTSTTEEKTSATSITDEVNEKKITLSEYDQTVIQNARDQDYFVYQISVHLIENCLIKSARAFLVIKNLEEKGEIIKCVPSVEELEEEDFESFFQLIYITKEPQDVVQKIILGISEIQRVEIKPLVLKKIQTKKQGEKSKVQEKLKKSSKEEIKNKNNLGQSFTNRGKLNQSVRVDIQKLDDFMNLVSELVIHRTRLEQISNHHKLNDLRETLEQVARITTDLQDLVLKIRMIPIERVFNRFPRMVRDLSKELDKEIDLVIEGEETELDRTVIDELGDPLVHLIRNAVDHGIESKEERIQKGKDPKGIVKLIAYQEGNQAIIQISDDGNGMDPEVIKKKAVEKGISVEGLGEEEIIHLIFKQGFSTNDKVTDISGRGVGMDVVREKISALGGSISVRSKVGMGSTFTIYLPLTLSIIQALLVRVASETFAISLGFIEKVVNVTPQDIKQSYNGEIYIYRGKVIPVVRLNEKLHLPFEESKEKYLVIVRVGERTMGLVVDKLLGQQEIVIKSLGKSLQNIKEYVGATILGDGLVTLILDPGTMI